MSNDFAARLAAHASCVETALETALSNTTGQIPARLIAAMRHGVLGGGKRLRPFLVIETASVFDISPAAASRAAAALECVHCYSLVHDDLPAMDNDLLRRGRPTVWSAFDEWTAILAGDGLLTLAFEILADPATHPEDGVRLRLVTALARAAGATGMVGGQCIDLEADKRGEPATPSEPHIRRLQAMKTGALIVHGVEAGALLGRASDAETNALLAYGRALGLAFQIADDLLDVEGDATIVGKAIAKDAAAGKATLVSLLGVKAARAELLRTRDLALDALGGFDDRADGLRQAACFVVERRS